LARGLAERHTVIRYDERGCGLSDRDVPELTMDDSVGDLETVVDAAGLDRFVLLGISGGVPISVAYAARHPERVERLVLYGGWARWSTLADEERRRLVQTVDSVIRIGWEDPDPAFRRVFTMRFLPEGTRSRWRGSTSCTAGPRARRPRPCYFASAARPTSASRHGRWQPRRSSCTRPATG
jgi:pimeloyl-ACP methyl ester carboxylesterase